MQRSKCLLLFTVQEAEMCVCASGAAAMQTAA